MFMAGPYQPVIPSSLPSTPTWVPRCLARSLFHVDAIITAGGNAVPFMLALKLLDPGRIECVAGASLPMLLRALTYRKNGMETLIKKAISGGHDGVINMHRH